MSPKFENNFKGYFGFYYRVLGIRVIINFILCILVSLLDGIGLAMFIPIFQAISDDGEISPDASELGQFHYITDAIQNAGLSLTLNSVIGILVIIFIAKSIVKFFQLSYQVKNREVFMERIRFALMDNLRGLSYKGFLKLDAGRIQNTLTTEAARLLKNMNYFFSSAQFGIMVLVYFILAFLANYQFAILVATGAALSNLLFKNIFTKTKDVSIGVSKKGNLFNRFLVQSVHSFKYLKSTNYFAQYSKKLKNTIKETEVMNKKMGIYNAIVLSGREPLVIIVVSIVILLQINLLGGTVASIILSLLLFYRAMTFLLMAQSHWQNFIQDVGAINSVATILDDMSGLQEEQKPQQFEHFFKSLELKDVTFFYSDKIILENINLTIPKDRTIALVGESGAGKTTLANIISGLVLPDKGEFLIDGVSLENYNLNSYRSKVGYIPQEPVIFDDSIYNNVTFWAEPTKENKNRFLKAIEMASLTEFVMSQPGKDSTLLGNNGILISGGQKQRISIARELYKNIEILILDEATSSLDSETEKMIQQNIEKLHGQYTIVIIAHRLSTVKNADVIYLMDNGRIIESGDLDSMLTSSEKFKRMIELQEF